MEGSESVLGWMMDKVMFKLIGEQIIYNVSWEDPRIDRALLRIQSDDRILMLTSAGCNVLDYLIDGPAKIVAADLNPRQNALLELKLAGLNALEYDEFWAIFGESSAAAFLGVYEEKLRPLLSEASASFWDASGESFFEKYMWRGMSGRAAEALVRLARVLGMGGFLDSVMKCSSLQEQRKLYAQHRDATSRLATLVNATRQFWAPFIGVPDSQLRLFDGNIVTKVFDRIFHETLLAENYFYAAYIRGSYSKENCPRYLEEEHFGRLKQFVREGRVEVRTGTLKDVVSTYPDGTFSCYVLLDHQDWLSTEAVLDEWEAFFAKADRKSGRARALWRSFSKEQTIAPVSYPLTFDEKSVINVEAAYPDRVAMYNSCHLAFFPSGEPEYAFVKRDAFAPKATCCDDARVMFSNMLAPIAKTDEQQERLESFYARQAGSYDVFRHRMLHGRVPMLLNMPVKRGATWVDIGGGTGSNLEHFSSSMDLFGKVVVLDLCRPLAAVCRERIEANGWSNVSVVIGDATEFPNRNLPQAGTVDIVTFSYSLTMIPDWQAALRHALQLLKPGGHLCVCDFTVTADHWAWRRWMWKSIFANDHVMLSEEHLPELRSLTKEIAHGLSDGTFPYVPRCFKAPYYYYVGEKVAEPESTRGSTRGASAGLNLRKRK